MKIYCNQILYVLDTKTFSWKENCAVAGEWFSHFKGFETGAKLLKSHGKAMVKPINVYLGETVWTRHLRNITQVNFLWVAVVIVAFTSSPHATKCNESFLNVLNCWLRQDWRSHTSGRLGVHKGCELYGNSVSNGILVCYFTSQAGEKSISLLLLSFTRQPKKRSPNSDTVITSKSRERISWGLLTHVKNKI